MEQASLDAILSEHKEWWASNGERGKHADLRGADLQGADLRGADLRGADLRGADLQGADLRGAYLQGADLRGAYLQGAYLRGADLRGADLRGAYLRGAYLQGACLRGADLRGADLRGAYLQGAYLQGAYLRGAGNDKDKIIIRRVVCIGPIGSRADYAMAYDTDRGVYVAAGCFLDTLDEFVKAVMARHTAGTQHAVDYGAWIAFLREWDKGSAAREVTPNESRTAREGRS